MPWRKALENVADVEEYYLDIPGFSPGMTWYEARFPSGHEGRRMVHTAAQMREELSGLQVFRSSADGRWVPFEPEEAVGAPLHYERSEERRVGKECRSRWSPYH